MKVIIASAFALVVAGCMSFSDICTNEAKAHGKYMLYVAPFRTAEQVAKAINYHTEVQAACATGKSISIIRALIGKAEGARK